MIMYTRLFCVIVMYKVNATQDLVLAMLRKLAAEIWSVDYPSPREISICDMVKDPFMAAHEMLRSTYMLDRKGVNINTGEVTTSSSLPSECNQPVNKKQKYCL